MREATFAIERQRVVSGYRELTLRDLSPEPETPRPGQFINLTVPGFFLRRPISVCDWEGGRLTLFYRIVGGGTAELAGRETGELAALAYLGNGFDVSVSGERPLLIGGGLGVAPLYYLAKTLTRQGKRPMAALGFRTAGDAFYVERFRALGCQVTPVTEDGTLGEKGFVTDHLPEGYTHFYTCGPEIMMRAVYGRTGTEGQFSFEERMGCGFGACVGCTRRMKSGFRRVCKDGPVFRKEEILWED